MHYVIVVHGIGEQRKNETVLSVVNRFAEARHGKTEKDISDILTLGKALGQTGKEKKTGDCRYLPPKNDFQPWLEFEGIPQNPAAPIPSTPFLGEPPCTPGNNLRFIDMCWADIMQNDYGDVGQDVLPWAKGLLGRLRRKDEWAHANNTPGATVPKWVLKTLGLLVETLILTGKAMSFRLKDAKDLIFTKFLGDVQQYGEYSRCRGQAVRRFHKLMTRVHHQHLQDHPHIDPQYTVIAHSLGTVMSMDAILYARAQRAVREGNLSISPNLPFEGYLKEGENTLIENNKQGSLTADEQKKYQDEMLEELLDAKWIDHLKSFVTLGSPIDKYLIMWWMNYKYLTEPASWLEPEKPRIDHYNYCDEQDPVGHELDVAATAPGFASVFHTHEDRVFTRYVIPGAAHNEYWKDLNLFKWILHKTVDQSAGTPPKEPEWFVPKVYKRVLDITYVGIPFAAILLAYFSFTWVMAQNDNSLQSQALAFLIFVGALWLGKRLIEFTVWWRQVLRAKSNKAWKRNNVSPQVNTDSRKRKRAAIWFNVRTWLWLLTNLILAGMAWRFYASQWSKDFPWGLLGLILALTIIISFLYHLKTRSASFEEAEVDIDAGKWTECGVSLTVVSIATVLLLAALPCTIKKLSHGENLRYEELHRDTILDLLAKEEKTEALSEGVPTLKSLQATHSKMEKKLIKFTFNLASLFTIATYILGYRMGVYLYVKRKLGKWGVPQIDFVNYAGKP